MDREEPRSQLSIRQPYEREDANDMPFDIENFETHITTTAYAPRRDTRTVNTGSKADPPEREHGKGKSLAYRADKKADPTPNEDESLAPHSTVSAIRVKKLRTERNANFQRERTSSKTRATKSIEDALSI